MEEVISLLFTSKVTNDDESAERVGTADLPKKVP